MAFHKTDPAIRTADDRKRRPIAIGSLLTRLAVRCLLRSNSHAVAEHLLASHQFSYAVQGGVQKVQIGCTIGLQHNPSFVMGEMDMKNAHPTGSRGRLFEELQANPDYHFLLATAHNLYGNNRTPQWHFGNGPDRPPTSTHWSVEGLRQGDAAASVLFNILVARLYRAVIGKLDGRGILLAIADDVKILAPTSVMEEIMEAFPAMAWEECGLETQAVKNRVFVQPSARAEYIAHLTANKDSALHDIPDGRLSVTENGKRTKLMEWPDADGVKLLGAPLGTPAFVREHLDMRLQEQHRLISFISRTANAGHRREASAMLTKGAVPRLSFITKCLPKDAVVCAWAKDCDTAHRNAWLDNHGAPSDLDDYWDDDDRTKLTKTLDLPPQFGGAGLTSLEHSADEELLGTAAASIADITDFLRDTDIPLYERLAEAVEHVATQKLQGTGEPRTASDSDDESFDPSRPWMPDSVPGDNTNKHHPDYIDPALADPAILAEVNALYAGPPPTGTTPWIAGVAAADARAHASLDEIPESEMALATSLIYGDRVVEIPGKDTRAAPQGPEQLVLPEIRQLEEYLDAQCKGEISTLRQSRHVRQASEVFEKYDRIRQALMHGRAGQAGLDTAALTKDDVELVATMDRPSFMRMDDLDDSALYGVSTLQRFGLPFGGSVSEVDTLPHICPCCRTILFSLDDDVPKHERLFTWQHHQGRCPGDGRVAQAHDIAKLAVKRLAFCNPDPGGKLCPDTQLEVEPRHIRPDISRPADLKMKGTGGSTRDINMDITIGTATSAHCLSSSTRSSDVVLRDLENKKFNKDMQSSLPLQTSTTQVFIPLAINHCGRRGPHFNAIMHQFASLVVTRPSGCRLLKGPFAQTQASAMGTILTRWGARLTWVVQREFSAQILRALDSSQAAAAFINSFGEASGRPSGSTGPGP